MRHLENCRYPVGCHSIQIREDGGFYIYVAIYCDFATLRSLQNNCVSSLSITALKDTECTLVSPGLTCLDTLEAF
jgi:hypothetical protein